MIDPLILPLKKVPNARDLGNYSTQSGQRIKKQRLIRTGKLYKLPQSDVAFLEKYGVNQIIDLRSLREVKAEPDSKILAAKHLVIPIHARGDADVEERLAQLRSKYAEDQYAGFKKMCLQYRSSVLDKGAQAAFHKVLVALAENKSGATIFHCSEGKDRTGLVTFYLLFILGVDLEIIRQDYLFSNLMLDDYRAQMTKRVIANGGNFQLQAAIRSLGSVANEYLDTGIFLMKERWGSIQNYIRTALQITPDIEESLRNNYLADD
ncbi:tyrosine-protein phosphatase [Lactobacillus sp. PV037]|uniref:tyrosine-protein phosphatase n=1 Tax=unclassified Lactobacillus TaxID=2620435 RepID=UPI00223F4DA4|nr:MULTISPECIES: tyrosine-protein phosphatase [unclassified Lactobacillus]QNQ82813.1 tyrosine-protein phosphatase [Lactobacillus sp. PV012]QNQ83065.1 tyrosine-protein phosphatase [Lactobacillus sp. PV037]